MLFNERITLQADFTQTDFPRKLLLSVLLAGTLPFVIDVRIYGGIYHPADSPLFEVSSDGMVAPIAFENFRPLLGNVMAAANPDSEIHKRLLERVDPFTKQPTDQLTAQALTALTADWMVLRKTENALNLLQPLVRNRGDRRTDFFLVAHLAQIHIDRGEWSEAYTQQYSALRDYPTPKSFPKMTTEQLDWYRKLERDYYLPWIRHRTEEARQRKNSLQEDVDPIFPANAAKANRLPVQWVSDLEIYEAGTLADFQKVRLPADALAIVQQMLLWNPNDSRLYWLLAELYNANGDIRTAGRILDECVDAPRNYSNKILMEHRTIIKEAIAKQNEALQQAQETKAKEQAEERQRLQVRYTLIAIFTILGLGFFLLLQLLVWRLRRKPKR